MSSTAAANTSAGKPWDMTPREFELAIPKMLETFCSSRWMFDCFDPIGKPSGEVVFRFMPGLYPPGGSDTRMVRCPACRRLSPPDIVIGDACLDCQDARFVAMIEKYQNDPIAAQMKEELSARWWRSRPLTEEVATDPEAMLSSRSAFSLASEVTDFSAGRLADEQCFAGNEPVTNDERSIGMAEVSRKRVLAHLAWLFNPKEGSTRGRGSRVFLLDDSAETLKAEIDYYNHRFDALHGQLAGVDLRKLVIPSAKRIDNPYRPDRPLRRPRARRKPRASRRT